ncbi:hypothetical protein PHLCEN_2v4865 [Hermanssonia centrifuga]|uniref:VLRF1 domain-containing protein n=1 Tax=Hermanssonia centrifuga TaxID=98765 RepID=A0A2R6PG12_9APHY|nr:hypothetical protein PHLCEN_2v4865 [Hermanssonia centrifuga]
MAPQEHYHAFSLPSQLLRTLIPRTALNQPAPPSRSPSPAPAAATNSARACNICLAAVFADVNEQRTHYRSDWHRYNVKIRLNGGSPVGEAQFAQLVDGLEDSISGSESSSDSDVDSDDAVSALVHKTKRLHRPTKSDDESPSSTGPNTPLIWFHSPPSTQLGIYKVLYPTYVLSQHSPQEYLEALKAMQSRIEGEGRTWALFMVAGGHFAGAVVRVQRPEDDEETEDGKAGKKGKQKKTKPDTEVLKHKTFHRYTTRRKQGGSQGANDNAKTKAVSAGAMLRRYGEQALRDDIRNLIADWADEIDGCERIFIRASVSNRKIFVDYENAIIHKGDDRLRTFPFPTRRPTQSELNRCLLELTRVKTSYLTEDALRAQDEAYIASLPKPKPIPVQSSPSPALPQAPKLSPEELARKEVERVVREKWTRVLEMVGKGRLDTIKTFWARESESLGGVDVRIPEGVDDADGKTILMVAVRMGQEDIVQWLLEEAHADPTIDVLQRDSDPPTIDGVQDDEDEDDLAKPVLGGTRRTAYDLARSREVRNVFRRCAADHPDWWDWLGVENGGARVPSILSKEMEEGREEKKKVRRKGLKDRVKEREAKEKERAPSPSFVVEEPSKVEKVRIKETVEGPRKLGGSAGASEGVAGLTPEMRAKVERERRARAAEARMKALGGTR